jgi:hypothetical protein
MSAFFDTLTTSATLSFSTLITSATLVVSLSNHE